MDIILTNTSVSPVTINDLGAYLNPGEDIDLLVNYTDEVLLDSADLKTVVESGDVEVTVNTHVVAYPRLYAYIFKLSQISHEVLSTLVHVTSDPSYTEIFRDIEDRIEHLEYYTDNTKENKTRQDVITRLPDGRVDYIDITQYDVEGGIRIVARQTIHRDGANLTQVIDIVDVT